MATIRKRGRYWILDYKEDGRRVRMSVGTDKAIAEKVLEKVKSRLEINKKYKLEGELCINYWQCPVCGQELRGR